MPNVIVSPTSLNAFIRSHLGYETQTIGKIFMFFDNMRLFKRTFFIQRRYNGGRHLLTL